MIYRSSRMYDTPNGVSCCWKDLPDFVPPDHVADPNIPWHLHRAQCGFDYSRTV